MNFNICKKCFEQHNNIIQYMLIGYNDFVNDKKMLLIKGLIKENAPEHTRQFSCFIHDIKISDNKTNKYISDENEQKEILKEIEPTKDCELYTEQLVKQWSNKNDN